MSDNIEIQASILAQKENPSSHVRKWLQECHFGTLGTLSTKIEVKGFPMGSIVPFCVDDEGRPIILIAGIAAHTKNLKQVMISIDPESDVDITLIIGKDFNSINSVKSYLNN